MLDLLIQTLQSATCVRVLWTRGELGARGLGELIQFRLHSARTIGGEIIFRARWQQGCCPWPRWWLGGIIRFACERFAHGA